MKYVVCLFLLLSFAIPVAGQTLDVEEEALFGVYPDGEVVEPVGEVAMSASEVEAIKLVAVRLLARDIMADATALTTNVAAIERSLELHREDSSELPIWTDWANLWGRHDFLKERMVQLNIMAILSDTQLLADNALLDQQIYSLRARIRKLQRGLKLLR